LVTDKQEKLYHRLQNEYDWLKQLINLRKDEFTAKNSSVISHDLSDLDFIPDLSKESDVYSQTVTKQAWSIEDRILTLLAAAPIIQSELIHQLTSSKMMSTYFVHSHNRNSSTNNSTPCFQLALWLIAGHDQNKWFPFYKLLSLKHHLITQES